MLVAAKASPKHAAVDERSGVKAAFVSLLRPLLVRLERAYSADLQQVFGSTPGASAEFFSCSLVRCQGAEEGGASGNGHAAGGGGGGGGSSLFQRVRQKVKI